MNTRIALSLPVVALLGMATLSMAGERAASVNQRRLEALKQLAGDWVEVGKDGQPTDRVISSIRVTSGGSAVQETLFPGTDHGMVSMYHLDGADLVMTHYCSLGNQPRLRAEPGGDANRIHFTFVSATNLKSSNDHYINEATFTLDGKDHFRSEWRSCKDGKSCHKERFDLVRKQK